MGQRFPIEVLLLMLGVVFAVTTQNFPRCTKDDQILQDKQECPDNFICPKINNCSERTNCSCKSGFYKCKRKSLIICIDSNECNKVQCGQGAVCRNTKGSYYCECLSNFRPIRDAQFCPSPGKVDCEEYKVKQLCNKSNEQQEKLEQCSKTNPQDPICSILRVSFNALNSSCNEATTNDTKGQLKTVVTEINSFLEMKNESSTLSNNRTSVLLNNIENMALISFIQEPRTQTINTSNLAISMKASNDSCQSSLMLMINDDKMEVPCQLLNGNRDGAVLIVYKDLASNLNGNFISNTRDFEENHLVSVNSKVVSGALTIPDTTNISHPVIFKLAQIKPLNRFSKWYCVFWDPQNNGWSEKGCKTEHVNNTHAVCSCSHLSSFAVIMAPYELMEDFALTIITYIGLSVSLICLCLSLLTFILCRSLRSAHTSILTALCGCLFLSQLLVLIGLGQKKHKLVCSIIAGGLHFLFLCTFSWMSIECVLLFMTVRNLRAVNYMSSRRSNFPVMCILAFGVPTVIVAVTAGLGYRNYSSLKYCWLHSSLVWSFLGPALVFIVTNTILLILTILLLRKRLASLNANVSTLKNTRSLTFKALAQALILGCTWSIGYFQFGSISQIMSYLFTICNSPQGAYIFIVHCLLNNQVRGEYRKFFFKQKKKVQEQEISTLHTISKTATNPYSGTMQVSWESSATGSG